MHWLIVGFGSIALMASQAAAEESRGKNGGRIVSAGRYRVELVGKGKAVEVFLYDGDKTPVASAGFMGVAILILDGGPARVTLAPTEGNRLTGVTEIDIPPDPNGTVQVVAPNGISASGKFN